MLIKISEVCKAACTHCLEDATPKGEHMTFQKFIEVINFSLSLGDRDLLISGGEPTENPNFEEMLGYIDANRSQFRHVYILSHGRWIDDNPERIAIIEKYSSFLWQITDDATFYPTPLTKETKARLHSIPYVSLAESLYDVGNWLYPQGRATKLGITVQSTRSNAPKSFNLRSMVINSGMTFDEAVRELRARDKMCSPSVNVDGSISMGESRLCEHVAMISDSIEAITEKIRRSQCNKCGMVDKLSPMHKAVINYHGRIDVQQTY